MPYAAFAVGRRLAYRQAGQTEALTGGGGWLTKVGGNTCGGGKSVTHFHPILTFPLNVQKQNWYKYLPMVYLWQLSTIMFSLFLGEDATIGNSNAVFYIICCIQQIRKTSKATIANNEAMVTDELIKA